MAELAEKSSLEILVPEVARNVLCSVADSKNEDTISFLARLAFLVSLCYLVIIVDPI
jgi:hypothetical protein